MNNYVEYETDDMIHNIQTMYSLHTSNLFKIDIKVELNYYITFSTAILKK